MAKGKSHIECASLGGIQGVLIGMPLGGGLGFAFGGPVGAAIGIFAGFVGGWLIGMAAGALICWLIDTLRDDKRPPFAIPRVVDAQLKANPNPVGVGDTCIIGLFFKIEGNDDRALMKVTYEIEAESATPSTSPAVVPMRSNAPMYQRWGNPPFSTHWVAPHDGREVSGTLLIEVTDGSSSALITHVIPPIRVEIHP